MRTAVLDMTRQPRAHERALKNWPGVGTWIDRRAKAAGDSVALIYGDVRRTYAEVATRVRRLASGLRSLGVRRGDRIAWLGPNHPAFLEALFASAKLGAILAPINHRLDSTIVAALFDDVAPRVVLVEESLNVPTLAGERAMPVIVAGGSRSPYERLIAGAVDGPIDDIVSLDDICLLPFTSGTTGAPKGVMLSHGNVTWNVLNLLSRVAVRADDITIASVPFFRTGGTGVNVLPVLFKGGTVVVPRGTGSDEVAELIDRHRTTIAFGNRDLLEAFTNSPLWRTADLTSPRTFMTGGSPVPERLIAAWHARGVTLVEGYGLSEAGPVVSLLDPSNAARKIGSSGRPLRFVETRIAGAGGTDVAVGGIGELLVRGPNVMAGYWKRPDATRRAIDQQGWLRTGDAVRIDDEGFLFIVGRMQDAYVSGSEIVHPGLVERALLEHPFVADACVVARNDGAVAFVVATDGAPAGMEAELQSLCARRLAEHARPAGIEIVSSLPRNPAGKVMRHLLPAAVGRRG